MSDNGKSFLGGREVSLFDLAGDSAVRESLQDLKKFIEATPRHKPNDVVEVTVRFNQPPPAKKTA